MVNEILKSFENKTTIKYKEPDQLNGEFKEESILDIDLALYYPGCEIKDNGVYIVKASQCDDVPRDILVSHRFFVCDDDTFINDVNYISDKLESLFRWYNKVKREITSLDNLQTIFNDVSIVFGKNPLLFVKNDYTLLACSEKKCNNDKINKIIENKGYTKKEISLFSNMGYYLRYGDYLTASLVNQPNYVGCPFFVHMFPMENGASGGFLCLYFTDTQPQEWQRKFFQEIADEIYKVIRKDFHNENTERLEESVFIELIEGSKVPEETIKLKMAGSLIDLNKPYRVGVLSWDEYTKYQAMYAYKSIANYKNSFIKLTVLHKEYIVMLFQFKNDLGNQILSEYLSNDKSIIEFLCNTHAKCGVSTSFDNFADAKDAYNQAIESISIAKKINMNTPLIIYDDIFVYDLIDSYADEFNPESVFMQKIKFLSESGIPGHTDAEILRVYLENESSTAKTAEYFGIHRNSVLYRIDKIKSILQIPLDDSNIKLRLLISFKIIDYLNMKTIS